jgi:hypothetical protein
MLQGAEKEAQKCHVSCAPKFLQGVIVKTQKCHFSFTPTSFIWATQTAQKCHSGPAQGRGQAQRSEMSIHHRLSQQFYLVPTGDSSNANFRSHQGKGQHNVAKIPTRRRPSQLFTGGHSSSAEMSHEARPPTIFGSEKERRNVIPYLPKGEANPAPQKCQLKSASPDQFTGGHCGIAEMPPASRPHQIWAI